MDSLKDRRAPDLWRVLPLPHSDPRPASYLHQAMLSPRMPLRRIRAILREWEQRGRAEIIQAGRTRYYRRKAANTGIALTLRGGYNGGQRSESSLTADVDWFQQKLYRLKAGEPVSLMMETPSSKFSKRAAGPVQNLVILTPGSLLGFPQAVLVSVLGKGSCVIHPSTKLADLVLAGIPAVLGGALMNAIRQTMKE